ncbi:hypothetical protein MNBD_GAMMA07-1562 [hydrothermal vent metagenome]|uniref:Uncharacterized protein n=2 Tax=hydrothermal vent metagenome TaxID=652676 RepID=A0A3B0X2Q2_9ZZZZ
MSFQKTIKIATLVSVAALSQPAYSADFSAPLIDLPHIKSPKTLDNALIIKAMVDDNNTITSVKIFYRIIGQNTDYISLALTPANNNSKMYSIKLPIELNKSAGLEYYIEARDTANNITQEPFPNNARKINFKNISPTKSLAISTPFFSTGIYKSIGIHYGAFSIDDPDGNTGTENTAGLSANISYSPNKLWRGVASLSYQQFSLPYSQTNIGQDITSYQLDFIVQRALSLYKRNTWVGFGLGIDKNKATNRGTELNNTFIEKFDDRNDANLAIVLDFGHELAVYKNSRIGINGKIYQSLNEGLKAYTVGLYMSF